MPETPDWLRLQNLIFTRWVNQKLILTRNIEVKDVVTAYDDGHTLVALMEVLSEKSFVGKLEKKCRMRVQKIDNVSRALNFVWDCGIKMKVKPSPEDLVNGDEKRVLGLTWAIMLRYLKFGDPDEGESLNAKDALQLWVNNKIADKELKADNFNKSFHNGMILCAIIHKHRPKLIDWDSLNPSNSDANIQTAFDAAEKYFGLEQYLKPSDIPKLDENSMVVYVSEYYYGIAEQRKLDLAARRIHKLIDFTQVNDGMRKEYNEKSVALKGRLDAAAALLNDRTIDNTLAGAQKKIEEFYDYKTNEKSKLIGEQLNLESVYNHLAMRLSHRDRPVFQPQEGCTLKDIQSAVQALEVCEAERKLELHAELNRQLRLVELEKQHVSRHEHLAKWIAEKNAYLNVKEEIDSVGKAQYQLGVISAYEEEAAEVKATTVKELNDLGAELIKEKFERSDGVQERESAVSSGFATLDDLAAKKRPVLEDDLAREQFRAKLRLWDSQHNSKFQKIQAWIAEKEAYLNTKEDINSVSEAQLQLGFLENYDKEAQATQATSVAALHTLGGEILSAKYETQYSSASCENVDEVNERKSTVDGKFVSLGELSAKKKAVLEDDLAREIFKEKLRQMSKQHLDSFNKINAWAAESEAYLNKKEESNTVAQAEIQVALLESYNKDAQIMKDTACAALCNLGEEIRGMKYETEHSSAACENADELSGRESSVNAKFEELAGLAASKGEVLQSDLAREQKKEELRLKYASQASAFNRFTAATCASAAETHFGYTLEEVEMFEAVLAQLDEEANSKADKAQSEYNATHKEMIDLGATENIYTTTTLEQLSEARTTMNNSLDARKERYDAELQRQRENDELCKKFAGVADPLVKWIIDQKNTIAESQQSLEEQLAFVNERNTNAESEGANVATAKELQAQMDERNITNNKHTPLTAKDVSAQWDQWIVFLGTKQKMLEEEIEQKKLCGITPEEYAEIEANFKQFDKGAKGNLTKKELKGLLYSLGEEMNNAQVTAIIDEFGADDKVNYDQFKAYMVKLLGDQDTKDEILVGFKLINRGDIATAERMELVQDDPDIQYIKDTAPAVEGGWDYSAWCDDVFSR